jgi:hypothetical protein
MKFLFLAKFFFSQAITTTTYNHNRNIMGKGARACRMPGSFGTHKKFVQKKKVRS